MSVSEAAKTLEKKSSHLGSKSEDYIQEDSMPLNPVKSVRYIDGTHVILPNKSLNDTNNVLLTKDENTLEDTIDIDNQKAENEGQESNSNVDDVIIGIVNMDDEDASLNMANLEGMILAELVFESLYSNSDL